MKSVLISIRPKWCELIANGKKTIEVRKNRPQLETPFKCYIYCTKGGKVFHCSPKYAGDGVFSVAQGNGKIIGEFICDKVAEFPHGLSYNDKKICILLSSSAKMTVKEVNDYAEGKTLYGWHISDLTIYDRPRGLWEFQREETTGAWSRFVPLTRPPQSWCYVEEVALWASEIEELPAANVRPVAVARLEYRHTKNGDGLFCTNCGELWTARKIGKYCYNCGADMSEYFTERKRRYEGG